MTGNAAFADLPQSTNWDPAVKQVNNAYIMLEDSRIVRMRRGSIYTVSRCAVREMSVPVQNLQQLQGEKGTQNCLQNERLPDCPVKRATFANTVHI